MAAEQVVENLSELETITRKSNTGEVRFFLAGVGLGAAIGFFLGYRFNREKLKAEALAEAEKEYGGLRDYYRDKIAMAELADTHARKTASEIVAERGYAPPVEEEERPLPAPVPITRTFRTEDAGKDKMHNWSFPLEISRRTSTQPYIIHQDEFAINESGYAQVSYVYYAEDNVLVDEDESPINGFERIVGIDNLNRFGHGTDDYNILYIRNPVLELEMEICRSSSSYEVEVQGLEREPDHDDDQPAA